MVTIKTNDLFIHYTLQNAYADLNNNYIPIFHVGLNLKGIEIYPQVVSRLSTNVPYILLTKQNELYIRKSQVFGAL